MASPLDDARALALAPAPVLEGYPAAADAPGALADLCAWLAALPGADADRPDARLRRPIACLYVSADASPDATARAGARLEALASGAAPAAALARAQGAGLELFDLASGRARAEDAMGERECAGAIAFGLEAMAKTPDLLVLACAAPGEAARAARVADALDRGDDPFEALRRLGGREVAAMVGALLSARDHATPVLIDGEAGLAAAAVLHALAPAGVAHARIAARPASDAGERLARRLGSTPVLDLPMSEPEGAAGLAALAVCRLAAELNARAVRR